MGLLEVDQVRCRSDGREILAGLSLSLEAGEVHALLGTNGAGKSTLAGLIMGCGGYLPAAGTIRFGEVLLNGLPIHERARLGICMAWQEPARFEGLRVREYLSLRGDGEPPERTLHLVGLEPSQYLERMVDRSLSGGERKRIELASVLAVRPRLAILDEPDSGIDIVSTIDIIGVLEHFRNQGSSVLLITHRHEIAAGADRASQICGGRIVFTGSPGQVADRFMTRTYSHCTEEVCDDAGT